MRVLNTLGSSLASTTQGSGWMARALQPLRVMIVCLLLISSYWNIWVFDRGVSSLSRSTDPVVISEDRYGRIRLQLIAAGYNDGPIGFITNRDLNSEPRRPEDGEAWARANYAMVPWTVVRDGHSLQGRRPEMEPAFIIGDFWDAEPGTIPEDLSKHWTGPGVVLFRRNVDR